MTDTVPSTREGDEPGYFLGASVITAIAALFGAAWVIGVPRGPQPIGTGPVLMGLAYTVLGLAFWASYLVPHKSFLFRALLKFSRGFPGFSNPKMALFISFMCLLGGMITMIEGLGFQIR